VGWDGQWEERGSSKGSPSLLKKADAGGDIPRRNTYRELLKNSYKKKKKSSGGGGTLWGYGNRQGLYDRLKGLQGEEKWKNKENKCREFGTHETSAKRKGEALLGSRMKGHDNRSRVYLLNTGNWGGGRKRPNIRDKSEDDKGILGKGRVRTQSK